MPLLFQFRFCRQWYFIEASLHLRFILLTLVLSSSYFGTTARTRNCRTQKSRQGRLLGRERQVGAILPRRRHSSTKTLSGQETQPSQDPPVLHSRHRLHSIGRSVPRKARRLPKGVGERSPPGHRTLQSQWRATAQGQPGLRDWHIHQVGRVLRGRFQY